VRDRGVGRFSPSDFKLARIAGSAPMAKLDGYEPPRVQRGVELDRIETNEPLCVGSDAGRGFCLLSGLFVPA
jgi:hypothetical protein